MNKEYYTADGSHPDDAIFKTKTFINELQKVQEKYFSDLVLDLKINKDGEDWLFDYIYNTSDDENYDGFEHYLNDHGKKYEDLILTKDIAYNPAVNLLSTDFAEYSPMIHMSSYEPDLETAFPSAYNDKEPVSFQLDSLHIKG
jgi:hypothetical protein